MLHRRLGVCVLLMPLAFPLAAQQVASATPQEWQADAKANKHAQKAAEKAARRGMPTMKRNADSGDAGPGPGGDGPPGGMSGGMDGAMGGPGGGQGPGGEGGPKGKHGGGAAAPGAVTADVMLRPEMDFAAPLKDTLVLYRSREAMVFGSKESPDVVILPLSGEAVSIAPGVTAAVHDEAGAPRVDIITTNGINVIYRYRSEDGQLKVAVHAEGPFPRPGSAFDVQRQYRLASPAH